MATDKKKAEKYEIKLVSAKGGEQLRFKAEKNKAGKFVSYGYHNVVALIDGKKCKKPGKGRGASEMHTDFASARNAVDLAAKKAAELGWVRKVAVSRADSFDIRSLPAPDSFIGCKG
jgi:hypothetical protein